MHRRYIRAAGGAMACRLPAAQQRAATCRWADHWPLRRTRPQPQLQPLPATYRAAVTDTRGIDLDRLTGVTAAVEDVRSAVAALRRHPANRTVRPRTAAAASVRAARASAALDGAPLSLDPDTESVTDPVLAGALRVAAGIGPMATVWPRAPLQVLARLHTLAAAGLVPTAELGRPRSADPSGVDPLGADPGLAARLAGLAHLVTSAPWSAPVQVAVVHGELLSIEPFGAANGVVARAAARLTLMSSGLDPAGLGIPEVAHLRAASRYRTLAAAFAAGDRDGTAGWIFEVCRCLVDGAREGVSMADAAV